MLERRWGRGLCERGLLDHLKGVFEVILYIHYGAPIHVHDQQLGIVFHFLLVNCTCTSFYLGGTERLCGDLMILGRLRVTLLILF